MRDPKIEMLTIPFAYLKTICKYRTAIEDCKNPLGQGKSNIGCAESESCPIWQRRPTPWIKRNRRSSPYRRTETEQEI